MNTHINDYDSFLSIANLNAKIINPDNTNFQVNQLPMTPITEKGSEISTRSKTRIGRAHKNQIINYVNYSEQNQVLLAIQNNDKILKMIKLISKPIEPTMYLYTEDDSIVFVITSAAYYPVIILRFIVQEPNIYLKNGISLCVQFPYRTLLTFINQNEKQNSNYTLLIIQDDSKLKIEYHNFNHSMINSTENFQLLQNKGEIYESAFKYKMTDTLKSIFNPIIEPQINYYDKLQTMKLLFLTEINNDTINISKALKPESTQYLINVSENTIIMNITSNKKVSSIKLADTNRKTNNNFDNKIKEITPILYWNNEFINKQIRLINYINIFKRADKLPSSNDMIYYGICKYDIIPESEIYIMIKIVSNKNIKDIIKNQFNSRFNTLQNSMDFDSMIMADEAPTFGNVFNNTNYISEFTVGINDYSL